MQTGWDESPYFLAGERVDAGRYRLVGGGGREVILERADILPASLDGRVACYERVRHTWSEILTQPATPEAAMAGAR